jgi:hypothetical protein
LGQYSQGYEKSQTLKSASGRDCVKTRPLADSAESFSHASSSAVAARSLRIRNAIWKNCVLCILSARDFSHTAWVIHDWGRADGRFSHVSFTLIATDFCGAAAFRDVPT